MTTTLHEWHKIWISLYLDNQYNLFEKIETILDSLIDLRSELISILKQNNNPQDAISREQQIVELKASIVSKLDFGNRLLNLDLVPRDANFKIVDPVELSPIKLYYLHNRATSNAAGDLNCGQLDNCSISSAGSSSLSTSIDGNTVNYAQTSYHLQLSLKKFSLASLPPDELVEIYFSIVDTSNSTTPNSIKPITEKFLVQIKNDKLIDGVPNTIFTNLGSVTNRDVCLYVQVYRIGKMTMVDGHKTTRQQSNLNLQATSQEGSTNSLTSTAKYVPNGLSRNRNSTLGFPDALKYKRPFGVSMISLREFTKTTNFKENSINIKITTSNESDFTQLSDLYLKRNQSLKSNPSLPNISLDLAVKFVSGPQESLSEISTYMDSYCLTEKRGYPDIVMPGEFKNDLYFTLESAEFEKGGKSISKNIEASISLVDKAGLVIEKCISPGSNCDNVSSYKSCVFYHSNSPRWNESIKINVPLSRFDSVHIRIEFRHCSTKERDKKFLGFAFLPLSDEDGTVIADKSHELYLYKCDPHTWESHLFKDESLNLCKYADLPYGPLTNTNQSSSRSNLQHNFTHSNREIVTVSTFLLSTKLTQNRNLLNLLKWRELIERKNKDFETALRKVLVLKGEEIVKFLQDILDTLFDTFTIYLQTEDEYASLIFKVLVHIFILLEEPKYQHFRPVLDTYASAHFSATLVYRGLLACLKKCLEYTSVVEHHAQIQRCFKAIKYIFQFIVQSKLLYSKATGEQIDEPFLNDLRHLFKLFELMLANSNQKLIPIQVAFLESFPGTLDQLIKVISPQELAKVITSLVGNIGFHLPPALLRAKLVFMKETASGVLIKNQDIRLQITEFFCKHLVFYVKRSEELELCYDVLEILIIKIHDYHWPSIYRLYQLTVKSNSQDPRLDACSVMTVVEINNLTKVTQIQANQLDLAIISISKELEPFVNLMEPLLLLLDSLVRDYNADKNVVQKYCTFLLTILKLMGKLSFEQFMKNRQIDYLKLCNLFRSFRAVYNRDWSVMQLTSHSILEHPIDELSKDLRSKNDIQPMNRQLSSYIKLIVDFITHPTLQLEAFSERKKAYVLRVFGDLRIKFSTQLMRFWTELTKANIYDLIPTSIQSFLDAALLPNNELQQKLIPVFWDMIDAEDSFKTSSRQIERCLIDNLDIFMNLDRGDKKFIENFEVIMKTLIVERKPTWEQRGMKLVNSFTKLMLLLIGYRNSLENPEIRGKQMSCLVDLLNFYKDQDRIDLHLRYLFKLCDMHLEANNHVEAAFTLKLYTDELRWCHRNLSALDGYRPEEQEWIRKEALYLKIIQYFDLGKCWEENIALCKELASFYENFLVDYEKVSSTLKKLAHFLDCILTEHRPEREYFRVEFLGTELPGFVKGKEFIYRGAEYERLAAFMQRMNTEFPEAQVLNPKSKQTITKDSIGQYIVISNVKPVPFLQEHLKSGHRIINDKIIHYYLNNRLDTFSYDMPLIKGPAVKEKAGEVNVKHLWVGRYMLKLRKQLPDILPWSEVISQEYNEISPLSHAIETISSMNLELSKLILSYKNEANKQISPLTMRLQGVIEAAVNGGPAVFVNAFLKRPSTEPESVHTDPDLLIKLRDLIKQQFSILETGLALHSKLAPPDVMPLHARLVDRLQNTRKFLMEDSTQIVENNYELVGTSDGIGRAGCSNELPAQQLRLSAPSDSAPKDEVDSHDLNGNIYGEIEDQIYAQPSEPRLAKKISTDEVKSELSSPSRYFSSASSCTSATSSSLSTLAVLSNLPINRSRLSTPTKESMHYHTSINSLGNSELCARAARKLTYDSSRASEAGKAPETSRCSPSSNGAPAQNQDAAPPLPPRSFMSDKLAASRNLNRSPLLPARNSSPSDPNLKWTLNL